MVARYRNKRAGESPSRANRELAFLSVVFSVGVEEGNVKTNPIKGVRRVKLKSRKRCPSDEEYGAVYERAPEWLQDSNGSRQPCADCDGPKCVGPT